MEEKIGGTCKPLPIMRLTALLPPPPTPTTLILAESIDDEFSELQVQDSRERRRCGRFLLGKEHVFVDEANGEGGGVW